MGQILSDAFCILCTGQEVFSHELLFCKRVVLQIVHLGVVKGVMFLEMGRYKKNDMYS